MRLFSHGPDSNLLEHLREVMAAADNPEEKIICACHDAAKATRSWQEYIACSGREESPHQHAATGGLLAALLIRLLARDNARLWSLVALHVGSAHHSGLGLCQNHKQEFCTVAADPQAQEFFLDPGAGIASLLPEITATLFANTWKMFEALAPVAGSVATEFNRWLSIPGDERLQAFLAARSLLGRLCSQDHLSAARQSGKRTETESWQQAYPAREFAARTPRQFPDSSKPIHRLRHELKVAFHASLAVDSMFYFIDAPTGLGKTEAMLSAAEILRNQQSLKRIVFAVPQVSIADQIYADYFTVGDNAQIWNYLRQEKKATIATEGDNLSPAFSLEAVQQPFSESYNITTFNQVLLSMCHPHRTRCIRSIGLKDAVIIMDEFHKLPMTILPYFFRIAREYARLYRCRFIFGSATPLEEFEYLGLAQSGRIPPSLTGAIYQSPSIDDRRHYHGLGQLNIEDLQDHIEAFHNRSEQNLLVVLNLISAGTWPLLRYFSGSYNPWQQLELLRHDGKSRIIVFLDGLVPPMLRRQLVAACKEAMLRRPVTLITTQMVEVGVDLDFDHALIDYQGLAATIQRGGRVGREGRDTPCVVEVFSLLTDAGKSSFEVLNTVQSDYDLRMKDGKFKDVADKVTKFWRREIRFFEQWNGQALKDSELINRLLEIQNKIFSSAEPDNLLDNFFAPAMGSGELGVDFLAGQYIAELFASEYGTELLILEDNDAREWLVAMQARLRCPNVTTAELKAFNRFVADRRISVGDKVIDGLGLTTVDIIESLDNLKCVMVVAPVF